MRSLHEAGFYAAIMTIVFNTESSLPQVNYSLNILYNEIPIILYQLCGAFLQTISWMTGELKKNPIFWSQPTFEPFLKLGPKKVLPRWLCGPRMAVIGQ